MTHQETSAPFVVYTAKAIPPDPDAAAASAPVPDLKGMVARIDTLDVGEYLIVEVPRPLRRKVARRLDAARAAVHDKKAGKHFKMVSFWKGVSLCRVK